MDERTAIARLKQGDITGLETLVRLYQVRAVRAAYLITRDRLVSEDIAQAAFLRVYERIAQFDSSRAFGPWFLRSVVNDALKAAERAARSVSLDYSPNANSLALADILPSTDLSPEEILEGAERRHAVLAALDSLVPEQRAAVVLRYFLELSEAEVATQLDSPLGTIKWRLHSARARLRTLLASEHNEAAAPTPLPGLSTESAPHSGRKP